MKTEAIEKEELPSEYFKRKIAGLIIKGRFGRARREVARWNDDKVQKVHLLPTQLEQLEWAERTLASKA